MSDWITWLTQVLWRNGVAIVPMALIVWALVRWGARRPATRHALWLGALAWLVAGVMLPPIALDDFGDSASARNAHVGCRVAADRVADTDVRRSAVPESSCDVVCDVTSVTGLVGNLPAPESSMRATGEGDVIAIATESNPSGALPLDDDAALKRKLPADGKHRPVSRDPTPPTAIVRPAGPASTRLAATQDPVGQSSLLDVSAGSKQLDEIDSPACLPGGASMAPMPGGASAAPLPGRAGMAPTQGVAESKSRSDRDSSSCLPLGAGVAPGTLDSPACMPLGANTAPGAEQMANAARESAEPDTAENPAGPDRSNALREWAAAWVRVRDAVGALPAIPVALWLGVAGLLVAMKVGACIRFRRRLRGARPAPHRVRAMVRACAASIGLRRIPEAVFVRDRLSPMVVCGWRPRLVLPMALWSELDSAGRRAVVVHELAHLRRRDHLTHWFDCLMGVVYWWHPVVWWVRQRLRDEAENACDAWVTWFDPRERRAYATALLQARTFLDDQRGVASAPAVGVMSPHAKRFSRRLTMVMTSRVSPKAYSLGMLAIPMLFLAAWVSMPATSRACPPKEESAKEPVQYIRVEPTKDGSAAQVVVADENGELQADQIIFAAPDSGAVVRGLVADDGGSGSGGVVYSIADGNSGGSGVAVVAGRRPADADRDTDARLDRLERQMAELSEKLSVLIEQRSSRRRQAPGGGLMPVPPVPPVPHVVPVPRMAPARPVPNAPTAAGLYTMSVTLESRRYELPADKLAALTKLMSRSDVPIRVNAVPGGIMVYATEADQAKFAAFVEMISGKGMDDTRTYKVSKGKFDDLVELMARDDVPVLINYDDGEITVHGGKLIQETFRKFLEMIDPSAQSKGLHAAPAVTGTTEGIATFNGNYAAALKQYKELAKNAAKQRRREMKSAMKDRQRQIRELREKRQARIHELESAAGMIEAHADRLTDKMDELRAKAAQLQSRIEETKSKAEADELRESLDRINGSIAKIKAQVESLQRQANENEQQAEQMEREADELESQAEEAEEAIEPDNG